MQVEKEEGEKIKEDSLKKKREERSEEKESMMYRTVWPFSSAASEGV